MKPNPQPHIVFHECDIPAGVRHSTRLARQTWAMEQARALGMDGELAADVYADGSVIVRRK